MKKLNWILAVLPFTLAGAQTSDFVEYADCAEEDYVLVEDAEVSVEFQGSSYTPPCLKVRPGTVVQIAASTRHPLQGAVDFNGVVNPFRSENEHVEAQSRELIEEGFFGYFCTHHGNPVDGSGMGGSIWVTNE